MVTAAACVHHITDTRYLVCHPQQEATHARTTWLRQLRKLASIVPLCVTPGVTSVVTEVRTHKVWNNRRVGFVIYRTQGLGTSVQRT